MDKDAHSRALLYISFSPPSKGAPLLQVPLIELLQRQMLCLSEPSFVHFSKSLVNKPPPPPPVGSPFGAPVESDAHFQSLPLHFLQGPP